MRLRLQLTEEVAGRRELKAHGEGVRVRLVCTESSSEMDILRVHLDHPLEARTPGGDVGSASPDVHIVGCIC
jgi:hypothetical protein